MKKTVFLLICLLLVSYVIDSYAQKRPMKFGKVKASDFEPTACDIDSSAHAYFICDYGESTFSYASTMVRSNDPSSGQKGFQIDFMHHFRIHILDKEGFDWANVSFTLYREGKSEEELTAIKAATYNLENGKVVKTKLAKRDIFKEASGKDRTKVKFAMPNIKEGSIIEVRYSTKSDFIWNLQDWYFQNSIPVKYSEYYVAIPEYYKYNKFYARSN